jgi:hydroxyacylglutathione hydrolase
VRRGRAKELDRRNPLLKPIVIPLSVLEDNYSYVVTAAGSNRAVVVDPADGERIWRTLKENDYELEAILATHHHLDHIAGIDFLWEQTPVEVYCSSKDLQRIPKASRALDEGDEITLGGMSVRVLFVPGHTLGHLAYHCGDALFVGDTLFLGGCGRLFEGSAQQLFHSLYEKIVPLPDDTRIYPGHEYTVRTRSFCLSIDSGNRLLMEKLREAESLRGKSQPTVPGLLKTERETNVFLRCREPAVVRSVQEREPGTLDDPLSIFSKLRSLMDIY